jgi:hypothetical protein
VVEGVVAAEIATRPETLAQRCGLAGLRDYARRAGATYGLYLNFAGGYLVAVAVSTTLATSPWPLTTFSVTIPDIGEQLFNELLGKDRSLLSRRFNPVAVIWPLEAGPEGGDGYYLAAIATELGDTRMLAAFLHGGRDPSRRAGEDWAACVTANSFEELFREKLTAQQRALFLEQGLARGNREWLIGHICPGR